MIVGERLKFWKIGQYSIWGLLNLKYEVSSRQVPDSPPTRQGASELISGLAGMYMCIPYTAPLK